MKKCIFTIASITTKDILRQPVFYYIIGSGIFMILCSFSFTLFAFGEEIRMIQEMGISVIFLCCTILAVLSASNTISKELEKGTLLNLLSKPVGKQNIILGKFFGILAPVFASYISMGGVLIISLSFKHSSLYHVGYLTSFTNIFISASGELLYFLLQIVTLCTLAIAGSIFLPLTSNLCFCIFFFVLGNLECVSSISSRKVERGFPWIESLLSVILPNLSALRPPEAGTWNGYFVMAFFYTFFYVSSVIFVSCKLFELKEC